MAIKDCSSFIAVKERLVLDVALDACMTRTQLAGEAAIELTTELSSRDWEGSGLRAILVGTWLLGAGLGAEATDVRGTEAARVAVIFC